MYSEQVLRYDFGPLHPLRPERYKLTKDLMEAYGLFRSECVQLLAPEQASDITIEAVHQPHYVDTIKRAGSHPEMSAPQFGLGAGDNPVFRDMHEITAIVAGGSVEAARRVLTGELDYAFNMAGGLHHALPARASGFCIYNDPAIAIQWLLENGIERVAYIDTDAHHGDGVQWIFYDDPRVLTVSIHESGRYLFPGTGGVEETGGSHARGTSINVPLDPAASDSDVVFALDEVAIPLTTEFQPEFLVLQHGCDIHHADPLTHIQCTLNVFREIGLRERRLADDVAESRAIGGGGGGYAYREIVPRAWLLTFASLAGLDLPSELPEQWRLEAGVLASGLEEDHLAPGMRLKSTEQTVRDLMRELGRFSG